MIFALHGNLGSTEDWQVCEFFSADHQAVDLWDQVESGIGLEPWAEKLCDRASIEEKPWLAGYSLGGRLALQAMASAPRMWGGALIISAHPGLADPSDREARLRSDRDWAEKARCGEWEDFLEEWNAQSVFAGEPRPAVLEGQRALQSRREAVALAFENWSLGHQSDLGEPLSACDFPVLWLTGANDAKFSALGAVMSSLLPNCEHRVIQDCGHRILSESPQHAADAIGDFQKRNL